jgi:glycogen phosphorylase
MTEPIFSYEPGKFAGFDELVEIALDLRWSWNRSADDIWRPLDPQLWDLTRNPWIILETASPQKIEQLSADSVFRGRVEALAQELRRYRSEKGWFHQACASTPLGTVAYFSMEFMLGEALPIYSGGLGNVAGDQLKAASDLGVPIVGVGLLYQQGYFRQSIAEDGTQSALYPFNDPGQLQITPARNKEGEWVRISVPFPTHDVRLRVWHAQVGRVSLYLLDSNDPFNPPLSRAITSQLYGGGEQIRLAQELVLGIGGWRLLDALDLTPQVCHLNEGHSAFVVLERAADLMASSGLPFDVALHITRAGNVFTTHTPVAAGFDHFRPTLMKQFLSSYVERSLHVALDDVLALGRMDPQDGNEPFNMAYLAIRGSGAINGVSRVHGEVSRRLFQSLFSRWPEAEVPIHHVTNGIHIPTWDSRESDSLLTRQCGGTRWISEPEAVEGAIRAISDDDLWVMRQKSRAELVNYIRSRYVQQLAENGTGPATPNSDSALDPNVLTVGFARRFVAYKRPTLLLHDPERLVKIITDPARPVQLLVAGKAHPADTEGQEMIRQWVQFTKRPEVDSRALFLSDYDMILTEQMVGGVDLWINTPRRPWEACGTSGMKVLANGGLNLSELDGWWAEAYSPDVGWAIGDAREHNHDPAWDEAEAEMLYEILEDQVIPEFYDRKEDNVPHRWVMRMRESMATLTPRYSAHRAVRQYTLDIYIPAAKTYETRLAENGRKGIETMTTMERMQANWETMSFRSVSVVTRQGQHYFTVSVDSGTIDPRNMAVELYAETVDAPPEVHAMTRDGETATKPGEWIYAAAVPESRPATDYTPRIVPVLPGVAVPLELDLITWQR